MNVNELYPRKWVIPADLKGRKVEVTITRWEIVEVWNERERKNVPRLALTFKGTDKRMICNKTQCFAIARALNSEETADWVGQRIALVEGAASNKKPTIIVSSAAPAQPNPLTDSEEEDDEQYIETDHLEDEDDDLEIPE